MRQLLSRGKMRLIAAPSVTLNLAARRNLRRLAELLAARGQALILNLGCGKRFIGRQELEKWNCFKIINLDIEPLEDINLRADAHFLPFRNETFEAVITQALLEHTRDPKNVLTEVYRCLKKDGLVYAEVPFLQGFHPDKDDFYRFTLQGVENIFAAFKKIDLGLCAGPSAAFAWILRDYVAGCLTAFSGGKMEARIRYLLTWCFSPLKYFDLLLARRPSAARCASGFYFLGKKE